MLYPSPHLTPKMKPFPHFVVAFSIAVGCASGKTDAQLQADVVASLDKLMAGKIKALNQAARNLQSAAPQPTGRGWDAVADQQAIADMKAEWAKMRDAWESAEGVISPLFPSLDQALDSRYEELLSGLPQGDADLFDGQGVTGMHAMERILYAPDISPDVLAQEMLLSGYVAPAWPATPEQAAELRNGLAAELVNDTQQLVTKWTANALSPAVAFKGVTGLMDEQQEKVELAANHDDESRYSMRTLADLEQNLSGTSAIYDLFSPWVDSKPAGSVADDQALLALDRLRGTYATYQASYGDALPPAPPTWDLAMLSDADMQSPFGVLYLSVVAEVDPNRPGSIVDGLNRIAQILGLPQFVPAP